MKKEGRGFWLDDPEWDELRNRINNGVRKKTTDLRQAVQPARTAQSRPAVPSAQPQRDSTPRSVQISLNISLPDFKSLPARVRAVSRKGLARFRRVLFQKRVIAAVAVTAVAIIGLQVFTFVSSRGEKTARPGEAALGDKAQSPTYQPVLPKGEAGKILKTKMGYDPERGVTSYVDKIGEASITISQQPMPANLKANPDDEIKKIAESFGAKERVEADGFVAYVGTSFKGPQSVVTHKNGLLIFLYSDAKLDQWAWITYIAALE